jgi:hypothetical protein
MSWFNPRWQEEGLGTRCVAVPSIRRRRNPLKSWNAGEGLDSEPIRLGSPRDSMGGALTEMSLQERTLKTHADIANTSNVRYFTEVSRCIHSKPIPGVPVAQKAPFSRASSPYRGKRPKPRSTQGTRAQAASAVPLS